jgi:hypothetical protein
LPFGAAHTWPSAKAQRTLRRIVRRGKCTLAVWACAQTAHLERPRLLQSGPCAPNNKSACDEQVSPFHVDGSVDCLDGSVDCLDGGVDCLDGGVDCLDGGVDCLDAAVHYPGRGRALPRTRPCITQDAAVHYLGRGRTLPGPRTERISAPAALYGSPLSRWIVSSGGTGLAPPARNSLGWWWVAGKRPKPLSYAAGVTSAFCREARRGLCSSPATRVKRSCPARETDLY